MKRGGSGGRGGSSGEREWWRVRGEGRGVMEGEGGE